MDKIYLGCHVSMSSPDYYLGSVKEALSYGANTFMIYTGAPQNSFRLPTSKLLIEEARRLITSSGIDESKIVVHAPYIVNLGNRSKKDLYNLSINNLINELQRVEAMNLGVLILHPGNHVGFGVEEGLNSICEGLNKIFKEDGTNVKIALETMSGKGTELGTTFEQLKYIIDHVECKDRIGVCLDTCHVSDSGIDIKDVDELINLFDSIIGLEKLICMHINDSKNPLGAHKDRHENIGYGYIGYDTLKTIVHHPRLINVPKFLESPYIDKKPPYKQEIEMLLSGVYIDGWREETNLFNF